MTHTTPNMGLVLPDVTVTSGPGYAYLINAAEVTVDAHDHSTGKGVKVTPAGLNISSDLTFAQNNATNLRTARLYNNGTFTPGINDKTCIYALNGELHYIDAAGNDVQITLNGALDLSSGLASLTIKDANLVIENTSDITKKFSFSAANLTTATTYTVALPSGMATSVTLVTTDTTQTLTNKTLSGNTAATLISGSGTLTLNTSGTVTLPNATDTLVGKATTDTLSNKSVTGPLPILAGTGVRFNNSADTFYTELKAGSNAANLSLSLPIADGTNGQVLQTNGSGVLSFVTQAASNPATASSAGTITREAVWTAYTPTITGLGTVSNNSAFYKILGDSLFIRGFFTSGTATSALATITLPSGKTIDSAKVPVASTDTQSGAFVGTFVSNESGGSTYMPVSVLANTSSSTSLVYLGSPVASSNHLVPRNGDAIAANNQNMSYFFEVPLT